MPEPVISAGAAEDLAVLREAAREAGVIAMRYFGKNPQVWMKGGTSPVSEADHAADAYLQRTLLAARPDYGWLSEETADDPVRLSARRTFVVDPIDGTRGFLEGQRSWCVSVAVVEDGRTLAGVLECPAMQETYWALPGEGAFRNGTRIAVREPSELATISGLKSMIDMVPAHWQSRLNRAPYYPSLAYRLAMIANGQLDATFVKPNAHDWDIAAADLILREAGGELIDRHGRPPRYAGEVIRHGTLAAGSGALLAVLAGVIAGLEE
ncbi:3'(2'),5'-bisphosphate nucleotidase CysQ [Mesorhizobium sp. M00.F.Ca.ET.186.01.1.1]|nr:3'(2'),5'-bisphosphate nucleotidase CysQ [bacterium M00.F.Ca.ET.205.01.1.1]TGU54026.1 3'(2'),5'-bisphosphate nucleotidase CysQ [bacterium M00.F.Ca.ET.152.01.1.1]TGV37520.1 3'(2'),5'-bisphosphate nucleotidase CysQ [Mesorhizobium sp. M00.F.Ca.ET.186.01.1.1]TGZ41116.1 3'(2'),5'-bisphosphate nucleotidase CysQ [bacterium M00.F.Ca.ET.162.01.1.1]